MRSSLPPRFTIFHIFPNMQTLQHRSSMRGLGRTCPPASQRSLKCLAAPKQVVVVGGGWAGFGAAQHLASQGYDVSFSTSMGGRGRGQGFVLTFASDVRASHQHHATAGIGVMDVLLLLVWMPVATMMCCVPDRVMWCTYAHTQVTLLDAQANPGEAAQTQMR